jgi:hypothetical protein
MLADSTCNYSKKPKSGGKQSSVAPAAATPVFQHPTHNRLNPDQRCIKSKRTNSKISEIGK